jgi:dTDP-4-dehydrorhamnose reductase
MLGSMVFDHFSRLEGVEAHGASRGAAGGRILPFTAGDAGALQTLAAQSRWDYWINCIGVIKPYCKDTDAAGVGAAIRVNALFPHLLSSAARANGIRVIQIATDCVYSGAKGNYTESDPHDPLDVYGKTKSLGEVFDGSALNIRSSIIGPEPKAKASLLEWFLAQPAGAEVNGFTHHRWNGITTLRFAALCERIIRDGAFDRLVAESHIHHYVPADAVNKFELLTTFQRAFGRDLRIRPVGDIGPAVDRTLSSRFSTLNSLLPAIPIAEDVEALCRRMRAGSLPA